MILEYSSNEVSESQLDQISPECPTAVDVAKIKKMKKRMKLTIPRYPTVEGLAESFIAWYKDHSMTMSLRKALEANGWMEQMIHEFKWAYIRKYKISQDYAMRYPDEKLSDEDDLEEGGLADLVGPQRGNPRRTTTEMIAETSGSKGSRRPAPQKGKDSEKGADGSVSERTTKKKKAAKGKKGQGKEPGSVTSEAPPEKKQKGERKKKKKRKTETDTAGLIPKKKKAKETPSATLGRAPDVELPPVLAVPPGTTGHSSPDKPDHNQFNGAPGSGHGRFLGWTQKIYSSGWSAAAIGDHSHSEAAQAVLDTSSHG